MTPTDPWFALLEPDEAYAAVENHLLPLLREVQGMGYGSADFRQRLEDMIGARPQRGRATSAQPCNAECRC